MSTYKQDGVDKEEGYRTVAKIKKSRRKDTQCKCSQWLGRIWCFLSTLGIQKSCIGLGSRWSKY